MMSLGAYRLHALTACMFWSLVSPTATAQSDLSIWQCLPEQTIAAMRVPNGRAVLEATRATKFGQVMLTEERKAKIIAVCEKYGDDDWAEFLDVLEEYDLTSDEILGMLAGETGYALASADGPEGKPIPLGLGWLQPGEELVGKFLEVVAKAVEEQDDEMPVSRIDMEIADLNVMQLRFSKVDIEYTEEFILPDDYEDLSEDEQRDAYERAEEQYEASALDTEKEVTVLVCGFEDRLLIANQFIASDKDDSEVIVTRLTEVLSSVIAARAEGGADGFITRMMDDQVTARTMSADGVGVFELLGDLSWFIKTTQKYAEDDDQSARWIGLFGLDGLGPAAMRQTMDGPRWETRFSVSVTTPRAGLMRLIDQENIEVDPPSWVPASAVRYYQVGWDLGQMYSTIKAEVTNALPEETSIGFATAETQVRNFAQAELVDLLASLGNRHTYVTYGMESNSLVGGVDDEAVDVQTEQAAIVWQVSDEEPWTRLLKIAMPFLGGAGGIEAVEEQGFSGIRFKMQSIEGGLMLGKGSMVVGFGRGIVESVLSALNNPPDGSDTFAGGEIFARADELIDLKPAIFVGITDNERYLPMTLQKLEEQISQFERVTQARSQARFEEDADDSAFTFELIRAIMPTVEEASGLFGVNVTRVEINDDGLFGESMQETPFP